MHRYCGLLSAVYEQPGTTVKGSSHAMTEKKAKLALWTMRCAETPLEVVRLTVDALDILLRAEPSLQQKDTSSDAPIVERPGSLVK